MRSSSKASRSCRGLAMPIFAAIAAPWTTARNGWRRKGYMKRQYGQEEGGIRLTAAVPKASSRALVCARRFAAAQ